MNYSRIKTLLKSPSITSWLSLIVTMGGPLILIPLMSKALTTTELTLWLFIGTIMGLGLLADFGFSNTITRMTVYFHAGLISIPEKEEDIAQNLLKKDERINAKGLMDLIETSRRIYFYITIGSLLFLLALGIPMVWNIISKSDDPINLWIVFAISIFYVVATIHSSKWFGVAQGFNLIHNVNFARLIVGCVEFVIFCAFIFFKIGLIFYVLFYLLKATFLFLYTKRLVEKKFILESGEKLNGGKFDVDLFKVIWKPTRQQGIIFFGSYLINQGNSIVIAQTNDLGSISAFLFTRRIFDAIRTVAQVPFVSNLQKIYKVITTNSAGRRDFLIVMIMAPIFLMIFFLAIVYFCLPFLLSIFDSDIGLISDQVFFIMAISLILESHHSIHATLYAVTNRVPFVWQAILSGILIFLTGIIYSVNFGILGIVITQFAVQLLVNNWYPVYLSLRMLNWPFSDYIKSPIYFLKNIKSLALIKEL